MMPRPSNPSKSMSFYIWNPRFDPRWEADMKNNSGLTAEDPTWDDGDVDVLECRRHGTYGNHKPPVDCATG